MDLTTKDFDLVLMKYPRKGSLVKGEKTIKFHDHIHRKSPRQKPLELILWILQLGHHQTNLQTPPSIKHQQ